MSALEGHRAGEAPNTTARGLRKEVDGRLTRQAVLGPSTVEIKDSGSTLILTTTRHCFNGSKVEVAGEAGIFSTHVADRRSVQSTCAVTVTSAAMRS
ncbi:hypothetical protein BaRGS_00033930 [Batillaria attramentaria]|uniref:Uncharacterized protein n=1 Tax=Batillaria attramentaria TaxID=370345 RepID=A0ABD0JJB6_9CAEN